MQHPLPTVADAILPCDSSPHIQLELHVRKAATRATGAPFPREIRGRPQPPKPTLTVYISYISLTRLQTKYFPHASRPNTSHSVKMPNPEQSSNAGTSKAWGGKPQSYQPPPSYRSGPVSAQSVLRHQILAFPIIALLWNTALPFSPVAWVIGHNEGAFLFDRFIGGIALLAGLYFQFMLSGLTHPIAIVIPNPFGQSDRYVQSGRIQKPTWGPEFVHIYGPNNYYLYTGVEVVLLLVSSIPGLEYMRRVVVLGVLAALWAGGWHITPRSTKMWAWKYIKMYWTWIVFDLLLSVYTGGRAGGRRRRY